MSQKAMIRSFLNSGNRLTQMEATERWGCTRLAARIGELRPTMRIESCWVCVVNRNGDLARVKEYRTY